MRAGRILYMPVLIDGIPILFEKESFCMVGYLRCRCLYKAD